VSLAIVPNDHVYLFRKYLYGVGGHFSSLLPRVIGNGLVSSVATTSYTEIYYAS
jgi:hypothetical protein